MLNIWTAVQARIAADEDGATMVEYGIILALISVVAIVVIGLLGTDILNTFDGAENAINGDNG
jgi:pilus assembly protein Flp/PilA